jgi:excisionase family DNA binding protein
MVLTMTQPDMGYPIPDAQTQPTMRVWPDVGRALKLSKASTYEAVSRGEIPSIRIGRRLLVPTAALPRMLGLDPT